MPSHSDPTAAQAAPALAKTGPGDRPSPSGGSRPRIGLIAGWGRFPLIVAEHLTGQGYDVYCLAIRDHADPSLAEVCHELKWFGVAQLGKALRYLRSKQVDRGMMTGKVFKSRMLSLAGVLRHWPDWRAVRAFFHHYFTGRSAKQDDALLQVFVREFAADGIALLPATDFVPELLVKFGQLAGRPLSRAQQSDIEYGWKVAKELGRFDVGQSVAVKSQTVLAVEAIEGTDECLKRAGQLCPQGGFTVVKVAKPQQDMRFDVPTIGVGTLQTMHAAGATVLAVEAGKTILLDEPQVVAFARAHGMSIVAIEPERLAELGEAA